SRAGHLDLQLKRSTDNSLRIAQHCRDAGRIGARKLRSCDQGERRDEDSLQHIQGNFAASFRAESRLQRSGRSPRGQAFNPAAQPTGKFRGCLDFARHDKRSLPIVIDMALNSAFIKLNSRFFVFHRFKERLGLVILQLAVAQAPVKAGWPAVFPRLATEKDSRWAVAAVSFVARSLPGIGRSFPVGLSGSLTCLGTADLAIPFGLFAAADPA